MTRIKRLFNLIDKNLFLINPTLDYNQLTKAITLLANELHSTETNETIWSLGECGNCTLDDLIVGAFWHYTEWHSGQWSVEYAALSALGEVFSPGMTTVEEENDSYVALNELAQLQKAMVPSKGECHE